MKRYAIVLLLLPAIVLAAVVLTPEKQEHSTSPAFAVALRGAVNQLEGVTSRATSAAVPCARAGALQYTTDPITCFATNPECQELTHDERPCETLDHEPATCDHESPTCDASPTCRGRYTCDERNTCYGSATCDAQPTCWNSTCSEPGQTCDGEIPTCDAGANCNFTIDGTHTCNGSATCDNTCTGWPTCNDYVTCDITCEDAATCDDLPTCQYTCDPSIWPECAQPTYDGSQTCDGTLTCDGTPTCDNTLTCQYTCDSDVWSECSDIPTFQNTCDYFPTCAAGEVTCLGYPENTCDPQNPECVNATERTTWGKIKKIFKE